MNETRPALDLRRRLALAGRAVLRLALLPLSVLLLLVLSVARLAIGAAAMLVLIIAGNHHRDDEADAQVRTWRELALAPLWFPVALAAVLAHLWRNAFGGLARAIGGECAAIGRELALAARGR